MAEIQKINPEIAAHNIAKIFSEQYIKSIKDPKVLSPDDTMICTATKAAAQLYEIAYDEAYEYFSKENE